MKTEIKNQKIKKTRSEIQFGRVFSFYADIAFSDKPYEPYFFKVTIVTKGEITEETGMSVDLLKLNSVSEKAFGYQKVKSSKMIDFLRLKYLALQKSLVTNGIVLQTVHFEESRGLSVLVDSKTLSTIRHDFALDDEGVLFQVASQFDHRNKLTCITTRNLKLGIQEKIIF